MKYLKRGSKQIVFWILVGGFPKVDEFYDRKTDSWTNPSIPSILDSPKGEKGWFPPKGVNSPYYSLTGNFWRVLNILTVIIRKKETTKFAHLV